MAHKLMAHKSYGSAESLRHSARARKSGQELARTARRRSGPQPITVEGFVESIEQYIEAVHELQEFE